MTPLQERTLDALGERDLHDAVLQDLGDHHRLLFFCQVVWTAKSKRRKTRTWMGEPVAAEGSAAWGVAQLNNAQCLEVLRQLPYREVVVTVPIDRPVSL